MWRRKCADYITPLYKIADQPSYPHRPSQIGRPFTDGPTNRSTDTDTGTHHFSFFFFFRLSGPATDRSRISISTDNPIIDLPVSVLVARRSFVIVVGSRSRAHHRRGVTSNFFFFSSSSSSSSFSLSLLLLYITRLSPPTFLSVSLSLVNLETHGQNAYGYDSVQQKQKFFPQFFFFFFRANCTIAILANWHVVKPAELVRCSSIFRSQRIILIAFSRSPGYPRSVYPTYREKGKRKEKKKGTRRDPEIFL